MDWNLVDGLPIWQQLYDILTKAIATGQYPMGSRFPTVRELANGAGVNPNTMQRALAQLEQDGLVATNRTAGRTVTTDSAMLEQIRKQLAEKYVATYLAQMENLGFTAQEAAKFL